jgi:hypothetical protein
MKISLLQATLWRISLLVINSEITLSIHLRHIISTGLLFASLIGSSGAWAVDFPLSFYTFHPRAQVETLSPDHDSPRLSNCAGFIP